MKRFFIEWTMVQTHILYKYTNEEYRKGYEKTKLYHSEFDYVLEQPGKFRDQTISLVSPNNQATMFMVDDMVFKNYFALRTAPIKKLLSDDNILCVTIRMCPRINYCYTEKRDTPPPKFTEDLMWFWRDPTLKGDFSYPMSLDANLFRTNDILPLLKNLSYENPNTLEGTLAVHPINKPYMICYKDSLVFNIPVNKVQTANGNHCGNIPADYLNREFLKTKRISMSNLEFFKNTACHQEISLIIEDAVKYNVEALSNILRDRSIDYTAIIKDPAFVSDINPDTADVNVFIPFKDRTKFLKPCISYMSRAKSSSKLKIRIVILENDDKPINRDVCKELGVDYAHVPMSLTNTNGLIAKSLMHNIGYLVTPRAHWSLFHDVDILVNSDYFSKLEHYLKKDPKWVQPYALKRVQRLSRGITNEICSGTYHELSKLPEGAVAPSNPGSPGGSIVVRSDVFEQAGGYDPELFYGYAPEDAFFWVKLECLYNVIEHTTTCFSNGAVYANDPRIEVYHMDHDSVEGLNDASGNMRLMLESFLTYEYGDKMKVIAIQRGHLQKELTFGG
jgi:hypothetical protein